MPHENVEARTRMHGLDIATRSAVPLPSFIRAQFYAIALLGVAASSLAVFGMLRVVGSTESSRKERARDALNDELSRSLRERRAGRTPLSTYVGLHAGLRGEELSLPEAWRPAVAEMLRETTGARRFSETEVPGATLLVAAEGDAWAALTIRPSVYIAQWRSLALGILVVTLLLVTLTLWSLLGFRRSAEEARQANARLSAELTRQERLAALGRVAAGVAHEVRNPLASIKLRVDLAAAAEGLSQKLKETLGVVSSEISRLDRLVSDLLVVAGRKLGPQSATDLRQLVNARVEGMAAWAKEHAVALRVSGDAQSSVDAESVARALDNLLRNAVEASPRGGEVHALISRDAIIIEDEGAGVEAQRIAELFEPFFTTKRDGTGLGLAISRAIARAHGGELSYARAAGRTRLVLRLGGDA